MENKLATLSEFDKTLASVATIEDALELRRQVDAFVAYVSAKSKPTSLENRQAHVILQRTRRQVGKFLYDMEKNPGELLRGSTVEPRDIPTYEELGIAKTDAYRLQYMYRSQTDEEFEEMITEYNREEKLLTNTAVSNWVDQPVPRKLEIPEWKENDGWDRNVYNAANALQTLLFFEGKKALDKVIGSFPDLFAMAIDGESINGSGWVKEKYTVPYKSGEEQDSLREVIEAGFSHHQDEWYEPESNPETGKVMAGAMDYQLLGDLSDPDVAIRLEAICLLLSKGLTTSIIPVKDTYLRMARLRRRNENKNFDDIETQETISR